MARGRGQPRHAPTDETRKLVELAAVVGTPHHDIAKLIGTGTRQLLREYPSELSLGKIRANVKVGGTLYNSAIKGNVPSMIFWLKAQAGWRETAVHEHTGLGGKPIAVATASATLSDEDAMKQYLKLVAQE